MKTHFISWWNVENLFDVELAAERPEWLQKNLKQELKGWDAAVLNKKLDQIASVIKKFNNAEGPDIMGICEVENKTVVQKLIEKLQIGNRNYVLVHEDTKDQRGIDIAFIYDQNKYSITDKIFSYQVLKRTATRDIFQFEILTQNGNSIIFIGNHWPARSAGQYESEPYRMMAGETLSYWLKRIQEVKGADVTVVVMGDFNDNPYNRSLTEYALSTHSKNKVIYGRNPYLYNLMWEILGKREGTYSFGSEPLCLDQFLISKGILKQSGIFKLAPESPKIELHDGMWTGRDKKPLRFSRPSVKSEYDPKGYSDHFPISMILHEK